MAMTWINSDESFKPYIQLQVDDFTLIFIWNGLTKAIFPKQFHKGHQEKDFHFLNKGET